MIRRRWLFALLVIVATAAAVLSFAALRDLALVCGFDARLAWLLPVVIDAGAAAGSLVWLGAPATEPARPFARTLALGLLALSVAANALGHGLEAYAIDPPWWVVVTVSSTAPAVLGAVVHLAVLVGRPQSDVASEEDMSESEIPDLDERGLSRWWETAPPMQEPALADRARALVAEGLGRRRLAKQLGVSEHEARQLIAATRRGDTDGSTVPMREELE